MSRYCFLSAICFSWMLMFVSWGQPIAAARIAARTAAVGTHSDLVSNTERAKTIAETPFEQGLDAYGSGQFQDAIAHWQQALSLTKDPQQQAQILGNLAIAYFETGQYVSALDSNQAAIDLFTNLQQTSAVGQVQGNLGNVYEALGSYDRAIAAYQDSIQIAQASERRQSEGVGIGNLGYVYSVQGNQAAALVEFEKSLAIAREIGDRVGEGHRLLNMGIAYHGLEDIALAKQHYQQSAAIARELGNRPLEAKALINLGMATAESDQYDDAIALLEQSLAIAEAMNDPNLIARIYNNLGHTLLAANRLEDAEAQLRQAITRLESLRLGLEDSYNVSVFDTQIYTYNLLTQILVAKNEPEAALENSEAGRARAFAELLEKRSDADAVPTAPELITPATPSIEDIRQTAAQTNATLVEYALVPEEEFRVQGRQRGHSAEIHIWVVQPDGTVTFRSQSIDRQALQLNDLVSDLRDSFGRSRGGFVPTEPADSSDSTEKLKALHKILIAPIQDLLPVNPEEKVIFIPQEELFLVPFPALIDGESPDSQNNSNKDYLITRHTILVAPSIQSLDHTRKRQEHLAATDVSNRRPLVIGNPTMPEVWNPRSNEMNPLSSLPGAKTEALAIANLFGVEALTGSGASEQAVKDRIGDASIVHLATHGLLEYGNPQDTGMSDSPGAIALAPTAPEQDGLLTSAEILNDLTLTADLVVLSACDTGRGEITGDGVIGLARSFIAAGTPSVVVSLWAVPDAPTADLMVDFYKEISDGKDKAQALRQAMLNTMQDHPEPKNWAAFTLIGEAQ